LFIQGVIMKKHFLASLLALALLCVCFSSSAFAASFLDRAASAVRDEAGKAASQAVGDLFGDDEPAAKKQTQNKPNRQTQTQATPAQAKTPPAAASANSSGGKIVFAKGVHILKQTPVDVITSMPAGNNALMFVTLPKLTKNPLSFESTPTGWREEQAAPGKTALNPITISISTPGVYTITVYDKNTREALVSAPIAITANPKLAQMQAQAQAQTQTENVPGGSPETAIKLTRSVEFIMLDKMPRQPLARYYTFTMPYDGTVKFEVTTSIRHQRKEDIMGADFWVNGEFMGSVSMYVDSSDKDRIVHTIKREYQLKAGEHKFHVLSNNREKGTIGIKYWISKNK
jgi:hypothetical protein